MNAFRLVADASHLFAILILLYKIYKTRSCAGISLKSQLLFAIVFTTRYLDLFTTFVSPYNSVMKVLFIASIYVTCFLMYFRYRHTYNADDDNFRIELLILPCALLAVFINADFTPLEVLWTFSIYLEAVAILPQLFMLQKRGEAETITAHYLFCLGVYRGLYILNWVWRYVDEGFFDPIVVVSGVVQTTLLSDFMWIYWRRVVQENRKLELPI